MPCLFFLNVVMLTRLGHLMRDTPATPSVTWLSCAIQVASLAVFELDWRVLLLAALLIVVAAAAQHLERRGRALTGVRSLAFIALAVAGTLLLDTARFAAWSREALDWLASATVWTEPLQADAWLRLNAALFGLLLLTNEINLVIRYGFHRLNLEPKVEHSGAAPAAGSMPPTAGDPAVTDQRQYNAGRVIGFLERYFIFALLLAGADFTVIAVILAAKGFARFKQLDRREFAEYILIGTLASTFSAAMVALLVRHLL